MRLGVAPYLLVWQNYRILVEGWGLLKVSCSMPVRRRILVGGNINLVKIPPTLTIPLDQRVVPYLPGGVRTNSTVL